MQNLEGHVRAAIDQYQMISSGDHIAVGVSGGKDSMYLLSALASLKTYYPTPFTLTALAVDPGFDRQRADYSMIERYCAQLSVPFVLLRTELASIIFEDRAEKNPCSLCARMRRGILHNACLRLNCSKLALGHHMDDAIQTFLMNLFYNGKLGCFSPVTYLSRKRIAVIRPLIFCKESSILRQSRRKNLPILKSACPVDNCTARKKTQDLISFLAKTYPDIEAKVLGAMQRSGLDGWGKSE